MSSINGIVQYAAKQLTKNQKTIVQLKIAKNVGNKEKPRYVNIHAVAVGSAATTLAALLDSGNLPFGKEATAFSVLDVADWDITDSQYVLAHGLVWDGQQEVQASKDFKYDIPKITIFSVNVKHYQKQNTNQGAQQQNAPQQAPQQSAPAQQPQNMMQQPAAQQAPAQAPQQAPSDYQAQPDSNSFDHFDDDIPF